MKRSFTSALHCDRQSFAKNQTLDRNRLAALFYGTIAVIGLFLAGCKKEVNTTGNELQSTNENAPVIETNPVNNYTGLSAQTTWELQQARSATARYLNISNAIADGYADISVVVPNMGHHYLKAANVDATFDVRKPEVLVYNHHEDGSFDLVAVEYAIPLNLSANAPAGFTGSADVWDHNTGFGLWLLHAWVWSFNPNGVFNPTNPTVHVD